MVENTTIMANQRTFFRVGLPVAAVIPLMIPKQRRASYQ